MQQRNTALCKQWGRQRRYASIECWKAEYWIYWVSGWVDNLKKFKVLGGNSGLIYLQFFLPKNTYLFTNIFILIRRPKGRPPDAPDLQGLFLGGPLIYRSFCGAPCFKGCFRRPPDLQGPFLGAPLIYRSFCDAPPILRGYLGRPSPILFLFYFYFHFYTAFYDFINSFGILFSRPKGVSSCE